MGGQIGWGLMLVLVGVALNGSFVAPMKRLANWQWENTWLILTQTTFPPGCCTTAGSGINIVHVQACRESSP